MLIIEGSDLTGKTTLAKTLLKELKGFKYQHLSRLPDEFDRYWDYCRLVNPGIVQDRFHMSEPVYARVRGDETTLGPEQYRLIDAMLRCYGAFTVVLICEDDALLESRWREGEMYDVSSVKRANNFYTRIVYGDFSPYMQVDFDYVICETKARPFPTEQDVHNILKCYAMRQVLLEQISISDKRIQ